MTFKPWTAKPAIVLGAVTAAALILTGCAHQHPHKEQFDLPPRRSIRRLTAHERTSAGRHDSTRAQKKDRNGFSTVPVLL